MVKKNKKTSQFNFFGLIRVIKNHTFMYTMPLFRKYNIHFDLSQEATVVALKCMLINIHFI